MMKQINVCCWNGKLLLQHVYIRLPYYWQESTRKCLYWVENITQATKTKVVTSLKSIMALAISFPKKRNFILILAMCAGLVVLPKGTANSPLELNMYLVPSWLPVWQRQTYRQSKSGKICAYTVTQVFHRITRVSEGVWGTFRIGKSDLFAPPQAKVSPLELLRHQSIELQSGAKTCADLKVDQN